MSNHPVTHHDLELLERRMSALADSLAKLAATVDAVVAELATLRANAVTKADQDAIAAIQAKLDAEVTPPAPPAA